MENLITPELMEKAKAAKSSDELIALAKDNGKYGKGILWKTILLRK